MGFKETMENNGLLQKISKWISAVFNPLVSLTAYFIYHSFKNPDWQQTLDYFWPIFLIVVLPTIGWIYWNVKKGKYSNADVSDRNQRKTLYFFIEAVLLAYLLFFYRKNASIDMVMLCVLLLLVIMQISNYFIKSSMHTAFNVFAAALFFVENRVLGIIWLAIAAIVGLSRIIIKRHTPKEVAMGAFLAIIVSFLYLYMNIQFSHH